MELPALEGGQASREACIRLAHCLDGSETNAKVSYYATDGFVGTHYPNIGGVA